MIADDGSGTVSLAPSADRGTLDSAAHSIQLYDDDAVLLDSLTRFIGSALGGGDVCIVIATQAHRDGLAERLRVHGLDVDLAVSQSRYLSLDAAETLSGFMRDDRPDDARFDDIVGGIVASAVGAAGGRHSRVAVLGEMVALLWDEGKRDAAVRLEQLWNDLIQKHPVSLRCASPIDSFRRAKDAEALETICTEHSTVVPTERYTSLATEDERLRAIVLLQQNALALETELEEHRRMEQALRESNDKLRSTAAARDEFLSVAAHELKTPLTGLRAAGQLFLRNLRLRREISTERLEATLDAVELQTARLDHLMARLLDAVQIEAGKLRVEPVRTNLVALIRRVLARLHSSSDHSIVFEGPGRLDTAVDPIRFERVVANLLDNAIKFSPQGGTVTVSLGHDDDGSVWLSVMDEGVGIPPDEQEQIFDRFHRAHGENHLSGMGLGLYVTRKIVEMHGGSVRVEQPAGRGSRFVVRLPSMDRGLQTKAVA